VSPREDTTGALDRIPVNFGVKWQIALLVATYHAVPAARAAADPAQSWFRALLKDAAAAELP
jgi:hypothetical protein